MSQADFFIAGGTLRAQTPSYVTRPADQQLFERALAGEFCYVLTSRQMGKSSLMVRTARRLKDEGVATVIIDLTSIGTVSIGEWYLGLLTRIKTGLRLAIDVQAWWAERRNLGSPQRFTEFLHDVALAEIDHPIVIFIDEIDSTLNLDFRDDFFAAIRAMYNARASDPLYNRLTFVLLGVATPTDLIQDRDRTPFNIGRRIVLQEFDYADALPLLLGLETYHPRQGDRILARIFYWTNGHPYLTQKLCLAAAGIPAQEWDHAQVDALVESHFFSEEARKDTNLTFVQDRIRASPEAERRQMLRLYGNVYSGKPVSDDDRSPIQNYLELFGLVRVEQGKLHVRNQIYRRVFDRQWIRANTPVNTQRTIALVASLVALALVAAIGYILLTSTPANVRAASCEQRFTENTSAAVRIDALACLFDLQPQQDQYDERALRLFYDQLGPQEQRDLFLLDDAPSVGQKIVAAVRGIYVTLNDVPGSQEHDRALMEAMVKALRDTQRGDATVLITEINDWLNARELAADGRYQEAIIAYTEVITSNQAHFAARYERAMTYMKMQRYTEALADFDELIQLAQQVAPTPAPEQPSPPVSTLTPTSESTLADRSTRVADNSTPRATAVGATPAGTPAVSATSATVAALPSLPTPDNPGASLRFINSEQMIRAVGEAIQSDAELINTWREDRNAYKDLKAMADRWGIDLPAITFDYDEIIPIAADGGNGQTLAVQAQPVSADVEFTTQGQVPGDTLVPSGRASGAITISSFTTEPVELLEGTEFIGINPEGQEVRFVLDKPATVPAGSFGDLEESPPSGQIEVTVTALSPGSTSNIGGNAITGLQIPGQAPVSGNSIGLSFSNGPIGGGDEQPQRIVTEADIARALGQALTGLYEEGLRKLRAQIDETQFEINDTSRNPAPEELADPTIYEFVTDPPVGAPVDPDNPVFSLTVRTRFSALATPRDRPLMTQLEELMPKYFDQSGRNPCKSNETPSFEILRSSWSGSQLGISVTITCT